jgi:hypothetical protein
MGLGMGLMLSHRLLCRCDPGDSYGEWPRAACVADQLSLNSHLEEWVKSDYQSWGDWLLCRVFPEYEGECRNYYRQLGPQFITLHGQRQYGRVDRLLADCLYVSYQMAITGDSLTTKEMRHCKRQVTGILKTNKVKTKEE